MSTKVAIIGAGGMAQYHIAGFRQAGAEIVAIADLNKDAAKTTKANPSLTKIFVLYLEVLKRYSLSISILAFL